MKTIFKHIRKILIHKWWVFYYACKLGIPWRGFMHDWSKFSPTEFLESIRYYSDTCSPIPLCKEDKGYSMAWFHHRGHNPHHYEYWADNFNTGVTYIPMPFNYTIEMIADWLAAGRTYTGKSFTFESEWDWWLRQRATYDIAMNKLTLELVTKILRDLSIGGKDSINKIKPHLKQYKEEYENEIEQGNYTE